MKQYEITENAHTSLPGIVIWFLVVFVGYYVLSVISVWLAPNITQASPVWLPDGFALGLFITALRRTRERSVHAAILLAVLAANLAHGRNGGVGLLSLPIGALANVLQVFLSGIFILRAYKPSVLMVKRVGLFLVAVVVVINGFVALIQATNAALFLRVSFSNEFWTLVSSDALGLLLMTPMLAAWSVRWSAQDRHMLQERAPEIVMVALGVIASTWWAYARAPDGAGIAPPYFYFPLPFIVWAMLRFGSRGTTLAVLIHVLMAIYFTCRSQGPFVTGFGAVQPSVIQLQEFMLVFMSAIFVTNATIRDRLYALREKLDVERRYNAALYASDNLIFEIAAHSNNIIWAGDTEKVLGVPADQVATTFAWVERIHPDDRDRVTGTRAKLLSGKMPTAVLEYRVLHGSGEHGRNASYITVGVNAFAHETRLMDGINSEWRVIGFVKNISERKQAAAEKQKLETALHQAQKMEAIGQLAGGIAHDFNNILASILGYGEMARQKAEANTALSRHLDAILKAGERGRVLVSQILTFSRKSATEKQIVDIADLVDEVVMLVRGSAPHPIELAINAPRYTARVRGNATELHQLVMNLATNGIQAMPEPSPLSIEVSLRTVDATLTVLQDQLPPGRYVVVQVTDRGVGIDEATRARMFEPFFTTKSAGKGVGLGLSLAMSIARAHGGGIDLETTMGSGSTFTVYLPEASQEEAQKYAPSVDTLPRGQDELILLVDDEAPLRNLAAEMLAALGYQTASYATSAEALAAFKANPGRFDAILTDEVMPDLSGTQLALEVHKISSQTPVLIITGYGGPGFELRAQRAGVRQVLKKPYRQQEIAQALHEALQKKRNPDAVMNPGEL